MNFIPEYTHYRKNQGSILIKKCGKQGEVFRQFDGALRMEAACKRGLRGHKFTYGAIKKILDNNMDQLEEELTIEFRIPEHTNLRGPEAYN
jgi:hypothetical protein